jgi:multicomponent Na+:H+ antiporter subunit C
METVPAILAGLFLAAGLYLLLSRAVLRMLLGIVLLGNGVNLLILVAGRLQHTAPPILSATGIGSDGGLANPLPQALILTAIVIGFALFAYLAVLVLRAYRSFDADNTDHLRLTEPRDLGTRPPLEY